MTKRKNELNELTKTNWTKEQQTNKDENMVIQLIHLSVISQFLSQLFLFFLHRVDLIK